MNCLKTFAKTFIMIFMIIIVLATLPVNIYAESPIILLSAVTATGYGNVKRAQRPYNNYSVQVNITGAPTAVIVALEGNLDGDTMSQLASHTMSAGELSAAQAVFSVADMPVIQLRGNLTTLTGGSSPTVTMQVIGGQN